MPSTPLYDRTGKTVGNVDLSDALFAAPVNTAVLHQVVTAQLAARRLGTHDTRTRGEIRERTALPRWWHRVRTAPAVVRAAAPAQDEAPRAAWRADGQVR